jgi:uncharacterized protein YjiS (DUF1127 family)
MATVTGNCLEAVAAAPAPSARASVAIRLADSLAEWLQRARSRRVLAQMDERMLHDIGITRDTALSEHEKPFWRA